MTDRGKKIREAFLKKYGVAHPSQLQSVKEKIKRKREEGAYTKMTINMKQTLREKYGSESYNNLEKAKQTKLEKYGDENYNNREKMMQTNKTKYGMNVSPNVIKRTKERATSGEIGFKSKKYKLFLKQNKIANISQLQSIKNKIKNKMRKKYIKDLFFGPRLNNIVKPLFSENEYIGNDYNTLYKFECCKCGNEFRDTLYSGNIPRCLLCYPHNRFKSKMEDELSIFLKENNVDFKRHDRSILDGNEIDILLTNNKIGIECDGIIWHSELFGKKDRFYHKNKSEVARDKDIALIHIWDWEWTNKNDVIKSIILNKIGKSKKIYARCCELKTVSSKDKSEFLNDNHIQGDDSSSIRLGLYNNNELVSIMSFCKSRFDKKYQYEISRYCNKLNTIVIGGASKLFKYFIKFYKPISVVSYCDSRFFNGKVYATIGMKYIEKTSPNYFYFNKNNCVPITRIRFQKHKLKGLLKNFDPNLSEWENMQLNGYDRIWDCGNFKYTWENTTKQFEHLGK